MNTITTFVGKPAYPVVNRKVSVTAHSPRDAHESGVEPPPSWLCLGRPSQPICSDSSKASVAKPRFSDENRLENAQALLDTIPDTDPRGWASLANLFDIHPGMHMGQKVAQDGPEVLEWVVGQALLAAQQKDPSLAQEVFDLPNSMAGSNALGAIQHDRDTVRKFRSNYENQGLTIYGYGCAPGETAQRSKSDIWPSEMTGQTIAFLDRNPENGLLEEIRGLIVPVEGAHFTVKGCADRVFDNNRIQMLTVLPGEGRGIPKSPPGDKSLLEIPSELPVWPEPGKPDSGSLVEIAGNLRPEAALGLLKELGIQPNQGTGSEFKAEANHYGQLFPWKLGQFVALTESGNHKLAGEVLEGKWDKLLGTRCEDSLPKEEAAVADFQADPANRGIDRSDRRFPFGTYLLEGKRVAFLARDSQTRELRTIRGSVEGTQRDLATFGLREFPGSKFNFNEFTNFVLLADQSPGR